MGFAELGVWGAVWVSGTFVATTEVKVYVEIRIFTAGHVDLRLGIYSFGGITSSRNSFSMSALSEPATGNICCNLP